MDTVFGILTVEQWLAILRIGIGLIFGFLMPIALLVAIFLNLNYIARGGSNPKINRSTHATSVSRDRTII